MTEQESYWNRIFSGLGQQKPVYDDWLDKHTELLEASRYVPVIDLGCGPGCDSLYLSERGFRVISCDLSEEALQRVRLYVPDAVTVQIDLQEPLPFETGSANTVIADLSLHYFLWDDTEAAIAEIKRVLQPGGSLLCRLNSVHDTEFGAGLGTELEPNFYEHEGHRKRFFDEQQIDLLFRHWHVVYRQEAVLYRYHRPKRLWEIAALTSPGE